MKNLQPTTTNLSDNYGWLVPNSRFPVAKGYASMDNYQIINNLETFVRVGE